MPQFMIAVGREFGSGGHEISAKLAERLGVPLYDRNMLDRLAEKNGISPELLRKYDEAPRRFGLSRTVHGVTSSLEDNVANIQFKFLLEKASAGESFVAVGRCAEHVLRDWPGLISVFVTGDWDCKMARVKRIYGLDDKDAESKILRHDKKREAYHNRFSAGRWGDSRNYDLCFNANKYPDDVAMDFLLDYIRRRIALLK